MTATHRYCLLTLLLTGLLLCSPVFSATPSASPEQIHDLGVQSINGDGVPVNPAKGRYYIQQSALQGYPLGQYHLGILFFTGEGGPQNSACATWWLGKAAEAHNGVREMAQQALYDIQEEVVITTEIVDEQRCRQYSYNVISLPVAGPSAGENHAQPAVSKNGRAQRIYAAFRTLQNRLTEMWQPFVRYHERLMHADAHKAQTGQQALPVTDETKPDEPAEVIITLVLPSPEQKGEAEPAESMQTAVPGKPVAPSAAKKTAGRSHSDGDLRSAPSRYYTLQIGSAGSAKGLYERARRHKLRHYRVYKTVRNGGQWYVLVYGVYPTMRAAKQALTALPQEIQKDKPWVRSLKQVQAELH